MQNFDVLLPTSHTTSSRDAETNFHPQKPSRGGEKFDDVMGRALTKPSGESSNGDQVASEKPDPQTTHDSSSEIKSKHTDKSKKTHRRELAKDDTASAHATLVNNCSVLVPHILAQIVPIDEGSSENEPETGTHEGKDLTAVGAVTDASQLITAQLLGLPGAPLPVSTPSTSNAKPISKEVKGISNPAVNLPAKAEVSISSPNPGATAKQAVESNKSDSEPKTADAKTADPKTVDVKSSIDHPEKIAEKTGIQLPQDLGLHAAESHSDKTESISLQADAVPDTQNAAPVESKTPVNTVSAFASNLDGTSAAKQDMTMKKVEKMPKVAGPAEQDLPGNTTTGSEELSDGQKLSTKASSHEFTKAESTAAIETPASSKISTSVEPASPTITTAAVSPAAETDGRVRVLERTHDIVALHAMRLGETGSDSLHVVVKPGDGIQLSLELRKSQDGIEVHASLHKGDFEHLRQYWPELQQRLESRGVRMGTLTTSENYSSGSQQQFQQSKQQSPDQDPMYAGAFAEFALAGSLSEAPAARAARATAYRGWETWA